MASKQKIFIPNYISDANFNPARVQPRVLFYNGVKPSETYFVNEEGNSQPFEGFPYFDNYSGQNTTTASLSLLFNNEVAPYGVIPSQSLYTEYWETYVDLLYNPRTRLINASAIIPLAEYFKMELNDIVDFRGNYYHLRAINDYNLKTGECNIQLLGPILEDAIGSGEVDCNFGFTSEISTAECDFDFIAEETTTTTTSTTTGTTTSTTTETTTTTTSTTQPVETCTLYGVGTATGGTSIFTYVECGTGETITTFVSPTVGGQVCSRTFPSGGTGINVVVIGTCTAPLPTTTSTTTEPTTTSTTTEPTTTTSTTLAPECDFDYSLVDGTTTTTTTANPNIVSTDYLIVGGGGAGGSNSLSQESGGGGGAGGYIEGNTLLQAGISYNIVVGGGAQGAKTGNQIRPGDNGGNSSAFGLTAIGGGGGGYGSGVTPPNPSYGQNGGSGGGSGRDFVNVGIGLQPTSVSGGFGNNGGIGGGGGGAGGPGQPRPNASGGPGKVWLDGVTYARGGNALQFGETNATGNTGNGGGGDMGTIFRAGNGANGIVKIRYAGTPRATGGIITQSGGFTFHTFTTNGTFTLTII